MTPHTVDSGGRTIVVVPSLTLPLEDLCRVTGVVFYEERLLCFLLLLADPATRIVYTTSTAIDPVIIEYYLRFVPDPADARSRLQLVDAGDTDLGWLSAKLLSDRAAFTRLVTPGNTFVYFTLERGSAIMPATASRHCL